MIIFPIVIALLLSGCQGDSGDPGPAGPPGEPAPPPTINIASASTISATILSAVISTNPEVTFRLQNENGVAVVGLPASAISFKLAQLRPGTDGNAINRHRVVVTQEQMSR